MADYALAFNIVKNFANFRRLTLAVVQERNKLRDRAFEVHVVFPQRIIRVDEESLPHH